MKFDFIVDYEYNSDMAKCIDNKSCESYVKMLAKKPGFDPKRVKIYRKAGDNFIAWNPQYLVDMIRES